MKIKKYIVLLIMMFMPLLVNASTNTCERTKEELNIPDKINYNESMLSHILSTPCVNSEEKIYDFADLLTEEEENNLYEEVEGFIKNTNLDLAIVTTNENQKASEVEYADDFYDYNDFKKDGLLILIDMKNRRYYISTTGEGIIYYNDSRIDGAIDAGYNNLVNQEYYLTYSNTIKQLYTYYKEGISNTKYKITEDGVLVYKTPWIQIAFYSIIPTFIIILILVLKNRKVKLATNADYYTDKKSLKILNRNDKFVNTYTTKVYNPPSSSSGGGGTSSHSGSSGISHGGGGRSF